MLASGIHGWLCWCGVGGGGKMGCGCSGRGIVQEYPRPKAKPRSCRGVWGGGNCFPHSAKDFALWAWFILRFSFGMLHELTEQISSRVLALHPLGGFSIICAVKGKRRVRPCQQ